MALFGFRKKEEQKEREAAKKRREKTEAKADTSTEAKTSAPKKLTAAPADKNYASILIRPRITEKATFATEKGAYIFDVMPSATKTEIKEAVRHYYKVTPRKVNIVTVPQKLVQSRFRGRFGVVSGGKKAYVYLKSGDTIEVV